MGEIKDPHGGVRDRRRGGATEIKRNVHNAEKNGETDTEADSESKDS